MTVLEINNFIAIIHYSLCSF